jgi:uncharacterized protein (UPF0248 family)
MKTLYAVLLLLLIAPLGCGSEKGAVRSRTGPITALEIEDSGLIFNDAYDVVRHFRPNWLVKRGVARIQTSPGTDLLDYVAVYEDRTLLGDPEALRQISVQRIGEIEKLSPTGTQTLSPFFHAHGAIVVHTRVR